MTSTPPKKGTPRFPIVPPDLNTIKSRLYSISPDKMLRLTTISNAAGKILSHDLPQLLDYLDSLERKNA